MPLPNYGYENQEKKTHQDLVFEMAPEIVSDDENGVVNGKKVKNLRGKVSSFFKSLLLYCVNYLSPKLDKYIVFS